ncbi:ImmA/IrrE family metallo-endopeptidase [Mycobacteroides abscessus]|uniref:ImmA/IrrE family metallo-endopeptidase n=1 Tax=Mycobacteroides abscessus TaxID=36809 RepID=UPI0009A6B14D|nr:ImmA/IrrE family metallo-endopeptidase [Mycobacteroides abscessus]RIR68674.1 ImmA/IrrE family metallo-endopeptidase [Mycobacteroides abscessus]RIS44135.1 ImmA/IrrE family metallo-endopeptidase [Mycobacteroides abscessus]RIS75139.1 ImmA/IrrE family metallo-endopeptidase [Mycobacteroides abscessus]SLI33817.1 putative Zn peptidase [Mycobacteroides abscessus subsp. bolletii]
MTSTAVEAPQSRLSYSAIATYAEQIARDNDIVGECGKVDVHTLLNKLGGQIEIENRVESLDVRSDYDFTVYLPTHTSQLRDRFTIAHELGHYFLHHRAPDQHLVGKRTSTFTRLGRNVPETQANVFASNLLMPATAFKAAFKELGENLVAVADRFEVSVPAARVRAEFLGLPI